MTIQSSAIKLQASERMTDTDDGGGNMSAAVIQGGQTNNVFPSISSLARTGGQVSMRELWAHVNTDANEVWSGANVVVYEPDSDPLVSVVMCDCSAGSGEAMERADAATFVENYVIPASLLNLRLWGRQPTGSKQLLCFTEISSPLPSIGDVIQLSIEGTGYTPAEQYDRIANLTYADREVPINETEKRTWRFVTIELNDPLRVDFPGQDPQDPTYPTVVKGPTHIYSTQVADAAGYYSVVPVTQAISAGDLTAQVSSVYVQLVPSTDGETGIANQRALSDLTTCVPSGPRMSIGASSGGGLPVGTFFLGVAITPGTMQITGDWSLAGQTYSDVGGNVQSAAGVVIATLNYEQGTVTLLPQAVQGVYNINFSFMPAAVVDQQTQTMIDMVTEGTQRLVYTQTLRPTPAAGTVTVKYCSLGRWYALTDDGTGVLSGPGGGTIDYASGALNVTLATLPDVGTGVLYSWGEQLSYTQRTGDSDIQPPSFVVELGCAVIAQQTSITWTDYFGPHTVTANSSGVLTGAATGTINSATGELTFSPQYVPDSGTTYTVNYTEQDSHTETFHPTADGFGNLTVTVANAPAAHFSVNIGVAATHNGVSQNVVLHDDGLGNLRDIYQSVVGSFDYASGTAVIDKDHLVVGYYSSWNSVQYTSGDGQFPADYGSGSAYVAPSQSASMNYVYGTWTDGNAVTISYSEASAAQTDQQYHGTFGSLALNLSPTVSDPIAPGSVIFLFCGWRYFDRGDGVLYTALNMLTGAATAVGTIDYASRIAVINSYRSAGYSFSVQALLTSFYQPSVIQAFFATPGMPLAPASFHLRATALDGTQISGTSDSSNFINGDKLRGTVDVQSGVVAVAFGTQQGSAWVPIEVVAGSIRFDAVIQTYLPLNKLVIGLDPARLPVDGRVPVFRNGNYVLLHNSAPETLPAPLAAGETVSLSRGSIASLKVLDENGLAVPDSLYTADLTASPATITWADPLDLSAYQQPFLAWTDVEEQLLVTGVQTSGLLTFQRPISNDYAVNGAGGGKTYISGMLVFGSGTLQSRIENVFAQQTWTGVWSDHLIGNAPLANYNDTIYPIIVNNANAVTDDFAIIFTGSTTFEVAGKISGVIATGNINDDLAPINPVTSEPYFTLDHRGWGTGWVPNNVLRFRSIGAAYPFWAIRCVQPGPATTKTDSCVIALRGDS